MILIFAEIEISTALGHDIQNNNLQGNQIKG
jgi:hypothetical protein